MCEEEKLGRELLALLQEAFSQGQDVQLALEGSGVHWHVDATVPERLLRVHTLHSHEGAEYLCELSLEGSLVARGRTRERATVLSLLKMWLVDQEPPEEVYYPFPFVDERQRAMRALAREVDSALVREGLSFQTVLSQDLYEVWNLWVLGDERACSLGWDVNEGRAHCAFSHLGSQLAEAVSEEASALTAPLARWLQGGVCTEELAKAFPIVSPEAWAKAYDEGTYAEWRWKEVLSRTRDAQGYRPFLPHLHLLERLSKRVQRYFIVHNLSVLAFSRCPTPPFSTEGLPWVRPLSEEGSGPATRFLVGCGTEKREGDVAEVARFIEDVFEKVGDTTFYGDATEGIKKPLDAALAAAGSPLRLQRPLRDGSGMEVRQGNRRCLLAARERGFGPSTRFYWAGFFGRFERSEVEGHFTEEGALVRAIRAWVEEGVSVDALRERTDELRRG
jgi:hypothetical protein